MKLRCRVLYADGRCWHPARTLQYVYATRSEAMAEARNSRAVGEKCRVEATRKKIGLVVLHVE